MVGAAADTQALDLVARVEQAVVVQAVQDLMYPAVEALLTQEVAVAVVQVVVAEVEVRVGRE